MRPKERAERWLKAYIHESVRGSVHQHSLHAEFQAAQDEATRAARREPEVFCRGMRAWRNCIAEAVEEGSQRWTQRELDQIDAVFLWIVKSSLLDRIIYAGQTPRTKKCPVHQGRWSGLPSEPTPCGCGLTGWIYEGPKP